MARTARIVLTILALAALSLFGACASGPRPSSAPKAARAGSAPELSAPRRAPTATRSPMPRLIEPALPERADFPLVAGRRKPPAPALSKVSLPEPAVAASKRPAVAAATPPTTPAPNSPAPSPTQPKPPAGPAPAKKAAAPSKAAGQASVPKVADPFAAPSIPPAPASLAPVVQPQPERQPDIVRSVTAEQGMRIEIPFDGTAWTYLGEKMGKDGILYDSRRFEGTGVTFVLNAARVGDYVLRFQRQDALRGLTYDELIAVSVTPKPAATPVPAGAPGSVQAAAQAAIPTGVAPTTSAAAAPLTPNAAAQPQPLSPAAQSPAAIPVAAAAPTTTIAPSASAAAPDSPEGMLLTAKNELGAGRVQSAIDALDRLFARYPAGIDEAFYLYGLALEQNGPLKDIKRAYDYYKKVMDDYPQSPFWDKAADRVSYIERHYFEIR